MTANSWFPSRQRGALRTRRAFRAAPQSYRGAARTWRRRDGHGRRPIGSDVTEMRACKTNPNPAQLTGRAHRAWSNRRDEPTAALRHEVVTAQNEPKTAQIALRAGAFSRSCKTNPTGSLSAASWRDNLKATARAPEPPVHASNDGRSEPTEHAKHNKKPVVDRCFDPAWAPAVRTGRSSSEPTRQVQWPAGHEQIPHVGVGDTFGAEVDGIAAGRFRFFRGRRDAPRKRVDREGFRRAADEDAVEHRAVASPTRGRDDRDRDRADVEPSGSEQRCHGAKSDAASLSSISSRWADPVPTSSLYHSPQS
jgi:hypothetical protein